MYVNLLRNFSLDETNFVQESTTHSMFNNFFPGNRAVLK